MKENLYFKQLQPNYVNNLQKQTKKRAHKINITLYWSRCGGQI